MERGRKGKGASTGRSRTCKGPGWENRAAGGAAHALAGAGRARPPRLRKKEMNGLLPGKECRERAGAYRVRDRIS